MSFLEILCASWIIQHMVVCVHQHYIRQTFHCVNKHFIWVDGHLLSILVGATSRYSSVYKKLWLLLLINHKNGLVELYGSQIGFHGNCTTLYSTNNVSPDFSPLFWVNKHLLSVLYTLYTLLYTCISEWLIVLSIFSHALAIFNYFLKKYRSLDSFKFYCWVLGVLHMFWMICEYFLTFYGISVFSYKRMIFFGFNWDELQFTKFFLCCVFGIALIFTFRSLIHFEPIFCIRSEEGSSLLVLLWCCNTILRTQWFKNRNFSWLWRLWSTNLGCQKDW